MRTTTTPAAPDVDGDVFAMDAPATLGFVVQRRRGQNAAAAEEMRGVTHWADLHRVSDGIPGAVDPVIGALLPADATIEGAEAELRLAGQGAYAVEEFAVCELAAALGMSEPAARAYLGQSLELRDRLPRCWSRVMAGVLPAWKARQIAEQTIPLGQQAAGYVDAQLASFAHQLSVGRILKCVEAAVLRFEPALAAERAARAAEHRGVWVEHCADGLSELHAVADTPDADAFDTALDQTATTLGRLGDPDTHDVRRAKALGVLADPQYALDLLTDPDHAYATASARPTVHVHLHTDSIAENETDAPDTHGDGAAGTAPSGCAAPVGVARVDHIGPVFLGAVTRWLRGLAPGATIKLTPVVDLNQHLAVDAYEVPDRLRTQIEHRDTGCVFPWCGRTGRYDLDHIDPYRADDGSGRPPPRQTNTANVARLCRFHHRVKTHSEWTYRRAGPSSVEWTSPHGRRYRVDHTGTVKLN